MEKSIINNPFCRIPIAKAYVFLVVITGVIFMYLTPGYAQTPGFSKGDVVRISSSLLGDRAVRGTVTDLTSGTVQILYNDRTLDVPYNSIQKMEVARGRKSHPIEGTLIGIGGGALLGAVIGAASYSPCTSTEFMGCFMRPESQSQTASIGAVIGGAMGGLFGLIIGAATHTPRWKRVSPPVDASIGIIPAQLEKNGFRPMINVRFSINRR